MSALRLIHVNAQFADFVDSKLTGCTAFMAPTRKDLKNAKTSRDTRSSVNGGQEADRENEVGSQGVESLDLLEMAEKMIQSVSPLSAVYLQAPSNF